MMRKESPAAVDLRVLLEHARAIPRLPAAVRARALDRARVTAATSNQLPLAAFTASPGRSPLTKLALALPVAAAIAAAGAFVASRVRPTPAPVAPTQASSAHLITTGQPTNTPPAAAPAAPALVVPEVSKDDPLRSNHPATVQESYAAELKLLRRAQSTFASGNFASTLTLVAEHARRFPNGRLAEEREALRVRSLASSGRAEEARRAAAAFATRFPRSVLLPRIQKIGGITGH